MTLIKLTPGSKTPNKDLKGHKLVILTPWEPPEATLEQIRKRFPGLHIEYHQLSWTGNHSPFPIEKWKDVTIALTFNYLPKPEDAPRLEYVQLISAGANHILDQPLFKDTEVTFCTANGVHG